jgi:hypothetical protein
MRWVGALVLLAFGCSSTSNEPNQPPVSLEGELGANDVSILFPLPASGQLDTLLSPKSAGAQGELLPFSIFEHAPELTLYADRAGQYAALRVVSARVDPCFPSLVNAPNPNCRFQVRLVLQPVFDDAGVVSAEDAAVHVFYDLPAGDFIYLLADLLKVKSSLDLHAPLGVRPAEEIAGVQGALLAHIGASRISRMTFMQLSGKRNVWNFGGFDFQGETATPIGILNSEVMEQSFTNNPLSDPLAFVGGVTPALQDAPEDLSPLYDSAAASQKPQAELWSLYESALRIENPNSHTPESVDCVSCHTAQPSRLWLERNNVAFATDASPERFTSAFSLTVDPIADTTSVLHAFGWLDTRPAITARVANESAAVAAYLNDRVLEKP